MKYLIGALVILALLFLVWWIISRGKQRQLDEQRAEAARIRAGAQERVAALQGQEAFAQQSTERADLARQEAEERARQAEESAREAQRVEEEARRHQAELERARLQRDAELRRADELDPDVEVDKNDPRPLPDDLDDDVRPLDETRVHTPVTADSPVGSETVEPGTVADSVTTPDAQEQGRTEHGWGTGAAAAGAGAAAAGSAYAATRGNEPDDASARLASGVDYSDNGVDRHDTVSDRDEDTDHVGAVTPDADSTRGVDDDAHHHDDEPVTREWAPVDSSREADQASSSVSDGVQGDERAQETTMSDEELFGAKAVSSDGAEVGRTNEERGLRDGESGADESRDGESGADAVAGGATDTDTTDGGPAGMTIIGDVEDYASTEPLPADEQTPGTSPEGVEDARRDADLAGDSSDEEPTHEEPTHEETWEDDTESRADVDSAGDSAADNGSHDSEVGGTGDWGGAATTAAATGDATATGRHAATDGDGSASTSDDVTAGDGDAHHWPDGTDRVNTVDDDTDKSDADQGDADHGDADKSDGDADQSDGDAEGGRSEGGSSSRRISTVDEIRDGGFGVGSAAPFEDRAQPLDHPVQAYRDTMTYRTPDADGYDSAEPDVWFYDEDAARRAGFNPSQG